MLSRRGLIPFALSSKLVSGVTVAEEERRADDVGSSRLSSANLAGTYSASAFDRARRSKIASDIAVSTRVVTGTSRLRSVSLQSTGAFRRGVRHVKKWTRL
jgi:hypothetical protein